MSHDGYTQDEEEVNASLDEGDFVKGLLIEKSKRVFEDNRECGIYKIKEKDGVVKVIFGTTILDEKMKRHEVGAEILIERGKNYLNKSKQETFTWIIHTKNQVKQEREFDAHEI